MQPRHRQLSTQRPKSFLTASRLYAYYSDLATRLVRTAMEGLSFATLILTIGQDQSMQEVKSNPTIPRGGKLTSRGFT